MAGDNVPARPGQRAIRNGIVILAGLVLGWFALAVSVDNVINAKRPGAAGSLGAGSDLAKGAQAADLLMRPRPGREQVAQAQELAEAAVRASPLNVRAIRALGLIATMRNDEQRATRLFTYAEALSRRDLPTQIWLIEYSVQRDNVPAALLHYDRALRTSVEARALLFPVLVSAAAQPQITGPLARVLAGRPEWWSVFMTSMVATPNSSPQALAYLLQQIRPDFDDPVERPLMLAALARLVNDREFARAHQLYRLVKGSRAQEPGVNDGGFEAAPAMPPFDWAFIEEVDLSASRESRGDGYVLRLRAAQARSGAVARQLLVLPAGRYRLSFAAGDVASGATGGPAVALVCAGEDARQLVRLAAPAAGGAGRTVAAIFVVPAGGCAAQWLTINMPSATEEQSVEPWIDQISITPSTGATAEAAGA